MRSWVEEEVKKGGLEESVHILGEYPVTSMPLFFALADTMLVTLKRDPVFALTVPGKVQSYLACAKPIIAALDGEGARVVEEAGAGLSCPAENVDALAEAVLKMYSMPEAVRRDIGKKGRSYYEANFESRMLMDKLEGWMKALVKM